MKKNKVKSKLLITLNFLFFLSISIPSYTDESNEITLTLENANILDLIRWASEITNKSIILHPSVQGNVTVIAGDPMSKKEAYDVFLSVLQMHGLTIINEGKTAKVIPDNQAKEFPIQLAENIEDSNAEEIVIHIIKVKNVSATNLTNILRPLFPQTTYLSTYPQTNTIVVADRANNINKLINIVKRMDQTNAIDIELINIQHAEAREIANLVTNLLTQQKAAELGREMYTLAVDERTNSILMTGDPIARQQIKAIINRLDKPIPGNGNTQVVRIEYANAVDLVPILQSVVGTIKKDAKAQGIIDSEISINAHEQLNTLVLSAPPLVLSTLKGIIEQLDIPRAQVLVEALIVEVNEDLAHNIGVEWQTQVPTNRSGTFGGFSSAPGDITLMSIEDSTDAILGTGLSLGYFHGGNLRSIINTLSGQTNANILSTPTVVSIDNEEAEILVGSNVPFITGSQQRAGDDNPFQTIQREDIGVTLKVRPRINNNNSVTLDIDQSVENIAQSTASTADIVTNKRQIKTRVLIPNDQILVLGGLIRDELSDGESGIPLLRKIPILGSLFRSKSTKITKTNLMVFIHTKIISNPSSYVSFSGERYNSLRKLQIEFDNKVEHFLIPGNSPLLKEIEQ